MTAHYRGALTKITIHPSLVRPMLFMGGDRTLVILALLLSSYLGYLVSIRYGLWWGLPSGALLWLSAIYCLREMAIADPYLWPVLLRAKQYKSYYPARGRFTAPSPAMKDFK